MKRCPCITAFGYDVFKSRECAARTSDHSAYWETVWILERVPRHFFFFLPFASLNLSPY